MGAQAGLVLTASLTLCNCGLIWQYLFPFPSTAIVLPLRSASPWHSTIGSTGVGYFFRLAAPARSAQTVYQVTGGYAVIVFEAGSTTDALWHAVRIAKVSETPLTEQELQQPFPKDLYDPPRKVAVRGRYFSATDTVSFVINGKASDEAISVLLKYPCYDLAASISVYANGEVGFNKLVPLTSAPEGQSCVSQRDVDAIR